MSAHSRDGTRWTRDETIVALGLYFQIPFGQIHARNPRIIELAERMGRTPSSLAMKMVNIGRLDPTLSSRGVSGLRNGSRVEAELWMEFAEQPECLSDEFARIVQRFHGLVRIEDDSAIKTPVGLDRLALAKYRVNQTFFRTSVLSAYQGRCCITGVSNAKLLVASHIKPWSKCSDGNERTNPQNGLCLNAFHDRAFDKGLFTLDDDYRIVLSSLLKESKDECWFKPNFGRFEGLTIHLPDRQKPMVSFLKYHRENIFVA